MVRSLPSTRQRGEVMVPLSELVTWELVKDTFSTVLSDRPPTLPIDRPWPPEQSPPVKVISVPELTATQSSWL